MSREDQIEREAIEQMVSQKYSSGYLRAVAAGIPVTYVDGMYIVREHNGERVILGEVSPVQKLDKPIVYHLDSLCHG